jgi:hypothetical protein
MAYSRSLIVGKSVMLSVSLIQATLFSGLCRLALSSHTKLALFWWFFSSCSQPSTMPWSRCCAFRQSAKTFLSLVLVLPSWRWETYLSGWARQVPSSSLVSGHAHLIPRRDDLVLLWQNSRCECLRATMDTEADRQLTAQGSVSGAEKFTHTDDRAASARNPIHHHCRRGGTRCVGCRPIIGHLFQGQSLPRRYVDGLALSVSCMPMFDSRHYPVLYQGIRYDRTANMS